MLIPKNYRHGKAKKLKTTARPVYKNQVLHLSRRTAGRRFFLKPSAKTNNILLYCLAVAANKHKILIHAYSFMSNHYHLKVTDTQGRYPAFLRDLNRNISKCLNVYYDRSDSIWDSSKPGVVRLNSARSLRATLEYIYLNPVEAFLSPRVVSYPGARSLPSSLAGKEMVIKRPQGYYKKDGKMPAKATLKIVPPKHPDLQEPVTEFISSLKKRVRAREDELIKKHGHKRFLGKKGIMKTDPFSSPRSKKKPGKLNPQVCGKTKAELILEKAKYNLFREEYDLALEKWKSGDREVEFPEGTYAMLHHHNVKIAGSE